MTKPQVNFLLDVNALIALCWKAHEHHALAQAWFKEHQQQGWATCTFTQAAFVRVILQPAFSGASLSSSEVFDMLHAITSHPQHQMLSGNISAREVQKMCTGGLLGHRQVTDAWLLTTAIQHKTRLVTFDQGIANLLATQKERAAHLELITKRKLH